MADRGHPVAAPDLGHPAQAPDDLVEGLDQVREVLGIGQDSAPLARVRQRPDQQMRLLPGAPARGRVRQLQPVPLGFLARRVGDDRDVPAAGHLTRPAVRAQLIAAQRAGERRVAALVAESATSSSRVAAHRCGSSASRARQ